MYNCTTSQMMTQMCELTYIQYSNGTPPSYNGALPGLQPLGFTQVASFAAPEIDISSSWQQYTSPSINWQNLQNSAALANLSIQVNDVYFGFAATSAQYNVIALRGTQSIFEWLLDANIPQVPVPLVWYNNGQFQLAKVHLGFAIFYAFLANQILTAFSQFNNNLPCILTGHSLGAALATMAAPTLKIANPATDIQLYNYASPRVGNDAFVGAYSVLVNESYRVVNLCDLIPMLPPSTILGYTYADVPTEWSFLNQSGNVAGNHALVGSNNYTDAVKTCIPTDASRTYPVTGL